MALEGGVQAEEVDAVLGRLTVCEYFVHVYSLRVTTALCALDPGLDSDRGAPDLALPLRRVPICEGESSRRAHQDHKLQGARGSLGRMS